ncbi:unnamed protein product [Phyllotreta striolata]|uniref:Uncharacterized protein n=1 Tax=Phyllotreta striolata TaxID=444603 RepID=A0A9N9TPC0_PHYSR|nr:unnamed protein product [Phyllotreta striolata]
MIMMNMPRSSNFGSSVLDEWEGFKSQHNKLYKNIEDENLHFGIFQETLKKIEDHNANYRAGLTSYLMGVNKFSDLTPEEFSKFLGLNSCENLLGNSLGENRSIRFEEHISSTDRTLPDRIDWRQKEAVLRVKTQVDKTCWAFAATGAFEGQNAIIHGKKIPLSEQELIDNCLSYGSSRRNGGDLIHAYQYVFHYGIQSEESYINKQQEEPVLHIEGYKTVKDTVKDLKDAVAFVGPVAVAMFADENTFKHYGTEFWDLYYNPDVKLNHAVLIVGYDQEPKPHWIVKNSWGADWGDNGYFKANIGTDSTNFARFGTYPIIK